MRTIKFRQEIVSFPSGRKNWHYWGYDDREDNFITPLPNGGSSYQFTGLHDKNGKEIYEGDIVKFRSHPNKTVPKADVRWAERTASFHLCWFDNELERERNYPSIRSFNHINSIEVIGNVHENPELLK